MSTLLIRQTFSQRTWPMAGDVDDCWVVSSIQCTNAVAPWLPLLDVREFRYFAKDPDDGVKDGGNVDDIMEGIRGAWPALAPLVTPLRGGSWEFALDAIKAGHPFSACVASSRLPVTYGFQGLHQVTLFHEPGVGLRIANPLAPDRSEPLRIATASARDAVLAFGGGKVYGVLWPTVLQAYPTHPLYVAPTGGDLTTEQCEVRTAAAVTAAVKPYQDRLTVIRGLADQIKSA